MKIAIVGAGAIGGYLGARLAASGENVTFIARGPNLAAIQANGMRLRLEDGTEIHAKGVGAFEKMRDAGKQDFVLLTLKAHQVGAIAADLAYLCHDDTAIVTMQNGIPWWYFYKHGGALEGTKLKSSDPDGKIAEHLDPARVIGSVVYPAANLVSPGVVEVVEGNRFSLGELDGTTTPRLKAIAGALIKAGFRTPIARDIRAEIWLKLWGNTSLNPVCALTHATLEDVCRFPPTRQLIAAMMAGAEAVGAHKPSTLQDVELGRPLELDALVGAVIELSDLLKVPTPNIRAVYACVSMLAQ